MKALLRCADRPCQLDCPESQEIAQVLPLGLLSDCVESWYQSMMSRIHWQTFLVLSSLSIAAAA